MAARDVLLRTLRSFFVLTKPRRDPWWASVVVAAGLALAIAIVLMSGSVLLMGQPRAGWWSTALSTNLLLGAVVGIVAVLVLRATEWLIPGRVLARLALRHDWRPVAAASVILGVGILLGIRVAYAVLSQVHEFDMWKKVAAAPLVQLKLVVLGLLVLVANWVWWLVQAKENALSRQAAESQLRMLQAQIEPHFLFNTLANVQSLIGSDAPRAQLMLEAFTDYLRASLGQMRATDVPLAVEIETARCYLQLMQIRMGRRLVFEIDVTDDAARALLPPLLLQPLVENAVHHGLEPKRDGGTVRLAAAVQHGHLEITVADDGVGPDAANVRARPGQGLALANIGERLLTRYAERATLRVEALEQGTLATLVLPWDTAAIGP